MKQTINSASQFRDAFHLSNRKEQFSYDALGMLFDYFEEIDSDMELDVIGICCDYAESTVEEVAESYSLEFSSVDDGDKDGELEFVLSFLNEQTSVVGVTPDGSIVYAQF